MDAGRLSRLRSNDQLDAIALAEARNRLPRLGSQRSASDCAATTATRASSVFAAPTPAAVDGEGEYIVAVHMRFGLSFDQATTAVQRATGANPGRVPAGRMTVYVRVCPAYVVAAGFPTDALCLLRASGNPSRTRSRVPAGAGRGRR
jgi:hypothetical protein